MKEKYSFQIAWLLGLKLSNKPVTITGRVHIVEVMAILCLFIILFQVHFQVCGYASLKPFKAKEIPSLHRYISLLLNWEAITYGLKK